MVSGQATMATEGRGAVVTGEGTGTWAEDGREGGGGTMCAYVLSQVEDFEIEIDQEGTGHLFTHSWRPSSLLGADLLLMP